MTLQTGYVIANVPLTESVAKIVRLLTRRRDVHVWRPLSDYGELFDSRSHGLFGVESEGGVGLLVRPADYSAKCSPSR